MGDEEMDGGVCLCLAFGVVWLFCDDGAGAIVYSEWLWVNGKDGKI